MAIAVLLITGALLTLWTAESEDRTMREQLLIKTSLATVGIIPSEVAALNGSPDDLDSPSYRSVKKQLVEYRATDPDIRFTYLIGRRPDGMYFFFVDSEPPESPDYSPPGQEYPEVTPLVTRVFTTGVKQTDGPVSDRWGSWVSGVIPVKDRETGEVIAVFGMDTDARDWYRQLVDAIIPPVAGTIIILILVLAFFAIHRRDEKERIRIEESEQAIRENEERYRLLFTRSPIGIVQLDKKGIIVMANDRYAEIIGASPEQLIGFNTLQKIENPAFLAGIKIALQGNTGFFEGKYHSVISGKDMYLRAIAQPLGTGETSWSGVIGIIEDITGRKQVEEALVNSETKYRTLAETSHDLIFTINRDNTISYINSYAAEVLGKAPAAIIGKPWPSFFQPEYAERQERDLEEVFRTGIAYRSEVALMVEGEMHWYDQSFMPMVDNTGSVQTAIAVSRDITERKLAEEELNRLNNTLSRQTRTLSILNKIIITANNATNHNELLEDILDVTLQLLDYDAGGIYLVEPGGNATITCSRNLDPGFLDMVETVSTDLPPYDRLFVKGLPLITDHYEKIAPEHARNTGYISMASVPLVTKNAIIGALNVASSRRYTVSEDEQQTLISIGRELGTIVEKISAEENLRETAQNLETLFNSVDDLVFVLDMNGNIIRINEAIKKRLHYDENELLNKNVLLIHVPEGREEASSTIRNMIEGTADSCHVPILTKEGLKIEVETKITRGWWDKREVLIGVTRDITDRKRVEEALKELAVQKSEVQYRTLIESANEGIFVIQDGKIPYANPKALKIIGYSPENLQNITFDTFLHPDDREVAVKRHMDRLTGKSLEPLAELRVIDKTGNLHWLEINAVIIDWEGRPATLNFITDISIRKKALEELKFRNVILSTQIESTPDGLLIVDLDGRIISYNHNFVTMFNISPVVVATGSDDQAIQSILTSVMEPERFLEKVRYLYQNRTEKSSDEIRFNDGRIIDRYSSPMIGQDGTYYGRVWYFRDITEKKNAEMKIIDSLHEKDILLKEIHHRVKNNLQVVSGLLQLQANQVKDTDTKDILTACRNRINSMALLHENLFQISNFSSVAMAPYVKNLIKYLGESYDTSQWLRFSVNIPDDIYLDIDTGTAVGMITTELITNSIKYAFPPRSSGIIEISLTSEENGMHFRVHDDGAGLPEGFDIKSSKGLGMKLVRNLVRQIQGSFDITQEGGTTISIVFNLGIVDKGSRERTR